MDIYGTHVPVLAAAIARTRQGPVLELGVGHYSTPMIHLMCEGHRYVMSVETDPDWLDKFLWMESPDHEFMQVDEKDWDNFAELTKCYWSVVFVDSKPGEKRAELILRLKDHAHFIVVHDTEESDRHIIPTGANYGYEPVFAKFKHRWDFKRYRPYTTVVSNIHPFGSLRGDLHCD